MVDDSSARITAALRTWVAAAAPGARLPSTRALVEAHGASPLTVQKALRALGTDGLIDSRPGVGTFVREVRTAAPVDHRWQTAALRAPVTPGPAVAAAMQVADHDTITWHSGYPERDLLPERLVRAALARASRGDAALARSPAAGLSELRAWFAHELAEATPAGVTPPAPADVVVVPGSQSGLSSLFRSLASPGAPLLVESPTYWGAIQAAARAGVRLVPVPSGPDGPDPDELARAFAETGARVFYAQPNWANPTGARWSGELSRRVLRVVVEHGAFLVEDDWAHDFAIDAEPGVVAAHDDSGHVIYLRSLTKSVSPALRVAGVVVRGPARERFLAERGAESLYVSGVLQTAAVDVVTQPGWQTHRRRLRERLRGRRDLLVAALREHAPLARLDHLPTGGLHLWARLPAAVDVEELARAAAARGLLVAPGREWFPAEPTGQYVRLNYSGPRPDRVDEGARLLGALVAEQLP